MALAACVATIALAAGTRTSFAAFLLPIEADLGLDRATLSTVGAVSQLAYGLALPAAGALATRAGARQVMMASVALMAVGGLGVAAASQAWHLFIFAGIVPGLGFAGASGVPATVLLAKWFDRRLGLATGIMSSAIPAGQGVFLPVAVVLIPLLGWRATYLLLGVLLAAVALPVLQSFAREPGQTGRSPATPAPPRVSLGRDVWLVGLGYFACGFTDQFVSLHLVALAIEAGLEPLVAASSLSLLLVVGIAGSVASGPLADVVEPRLLLSGLYVSRAAVLPLLLFVGPGPGLWSLAVFVPVFGLTYISNQAPGARLVRDRYGVQAVGRLMGGVGLAHQAGGAIGIAVGGASVTLGGGYGPAVLAATGVALVGGALQLFVPPAPGRQGSAG